MKTNNKVTPSKHDLTHYAIRLLLVAISAIPFCLFVRGGGAVHSHTQSRLLRTSRFLEDEEVCSASCCEKFQTPCESENPLNFLPLWLEIAMIVILLGLSALFSGLTLGLMGLDITGLEIVMSGDDKKNAECAAKIHPLRENGNLLLCTLLLGNVAVNALLSILLADKAGGIVGFLASTFLIVIFGEITPQALCSRYALQIGSKTVPMVRAIMFILYGIAKPLAITLDYALGEELTTVYSSAEIRKMLEIHVKEDALDKETANTMTGALMFKNRTVKQVMTPLENTYMLSTEEKLDFQTISDIFKTGYSRIPVYEVNRNNVIGLLLVKDLIFVDPEDETRVSDFVNIFGRSINLVWPDDKLGGVLRELKGGRSHMALVRDVNNEDESQDPFYEVKGIITLEDIIEEILGDEIVDETDAFVDGTHQERVSRKEFQWARLRLLDSKLVDHRLSREESQAVAAHLDRNFHHVFSDLSYHQLECLVANTPVDILPAAEREVGESLPKELIYTKGEVTDVCTLILSGKVTVIAGEENFWTDLASWSLLGSGSLSKMNYQPDFYAYVNSGPCRCIRISRNRFIAAVKASTTGQQNHDSEGGISGLNSQQENGDNELKGNL